MTELWNYIFGFIVIIVGAIWVIKRNVPVGIEGHGPAFYVNGKSAILLGITAISFGLFVLISLPF